MIRALILLIVLSLQSATALAAIEHPSLFFDRSDLPRLKDKIKQGDAKVAYDLLIERCETYLTIEKPPYKQFILDHQILDPLTELMFAWWLSGDDRYRDAFTRLFRVVRADNFDLCWNYHSAWILDMAYDVLNQDDKTWLKQRMAERAKDQYLFEDWNSHSNWTLVRYSFPALNAIGLQGEPESNDEHLTAAITRVRALLTLGVDADGVFQEGGTYLDYGLYLHGGMMLLALNRRGFDLHTDTNFDKIPQWLVQSEPPGEFRRQAPVGDAQYGNCSVFTVRILAKLLPNNPLMPYLLAKTKIDDSQGRSPIAGILLAPDIKPSVTPEPTIQNSKFYRWNSILSYKSSLSNDALYVLSQANNNGGHGHEDAGSFIMADKGHMWVVDPGYGKYDSAAHNSVLINGKGTERRGGIGAQVTSHLTSPMASYLASDLTSVWNNFISGKSTDPVVDVSRELAVIAADKHFAIPGYVMVMDSVRKNNARHRYSQAFQFDKDVVFDINNDDNSALIQKNADDKSLWFMTKSFTPEDAEVTAEQYKAFGRFPNNYQRLLVSTDAVWGKFVTMLVAGDVDTPKPTFKPLDGKFFKAQVIWPDAVDLWIWKSTEDDPFMTSMPTIGMFRFPRREDGYYLPDRLGQHGSYFAANVTNWNYSVGVLPIVKRWNAVSGRKMFYRDLAASLNLSWHDQELHVSLFTPVNIPWQIARLTELEIYAPNAKRVICNEQAVKFVQNGDFVVFTAMSEVPGNLEFDKTKLQEKMQRDYEANYFQNRAGVSQ